MKYVPGIVIEALDNIKKIEGIDKDAFAFEKLVINAEKGAELDFKKKKRGGRESIDFFPSPFEGEL